jgi:Fur family peroxide stress response transcriptional regulator
VQKNGQGPCVREVFERHGLRCTRQRERIFDALACTTSHPTAEELFQAVHDGEPGLSLATVYNTLEAFTECGLVRRIPSPGGACRYDADTSDHVHVTTPDGRVMDLPEDLSAQLIEALPAQVLADLEKRLGVKVGQVNIQIVSEARQRAERQAAD